MLPNTSGARNAEEAVRIARLAREVCQTDFVKVEIEHETKYLLPDNEETIRATEMLAKEGFVVVSLSWIIMSLLGALPFYLSGLRRPAPPA